jgi:hypothetical protein
MYGWKHWNVSKVQARLALTHLQRSASQPQLQTKDEKHLEHSRISLSTVALILMCGLEKELLPQWQIVDTVVVVVSG